MNYLDTIRNVFVARQPFEIQSTKKVSGYRSTKYKIMAYEPPIGWLHQHDFFA